jgi:transcriptional regulator, propionate catabolism operon regulatory protein
VLAHFHPMREHGTLLGAVMVCQDAGSVQGADRQLRISATRKDYRARYRLEHIVGRNTLLRNQLDLARRYARTDSTVLIRGESGTGKELFAQGIHNASARCGAPFVAINCASLPEPLLESELFGYEEGAFTGARKGGKPGLFELAHTGTLFLDEIGDMPIALQTRLLRVLQEREVVRLGGTQPTPIDVRVIAATHRPLRARIAEGQFREDLYYRLSILRLQLPALRERLDDVPDLARQILQAIIERNRLALDAAQPLARLLPMLLAHAWPGNVRELENVLERAALILCDGDLHIEHAGLHEALFDETDTPAPVLSGAGSSSTAATETLQATLARHEGNLSRTAKALGISRTTLWRRLKDLARE